VADAGGGAGGVMGPGGLGLFSGLALVGAVAGYVTGELVLGRGAGVYVAPLSAAVGLVLAWMLRASRPTATAGTSPPPAPREEAAPPPNAARQRAWGGATVRVTKSGRPDERGG
jgi:hypothetical protein